MMQIRLRDRTSLLLRSILQSIARSSAHLRSIAPTIEIVRRTRAQTSKATEEATDGKVRAHLIWALDRTHAAIDRTRGLMLLFCVLVIAPTLIFLF